MVGGGAAAQALSLRTCSQADLPLKFSLGNVERPGICVEIIRALQRLDTELQFDGLERPLPLKRISHELTHGTLDVFFSLIDTPERLRMGVDFLDEPVLYESRHQVAVLADDKIAITGLNDIARLGDQGVILVTHGTAYVEHLMQHPGLRVSKLALGNVQNLRMLMAGRGRFFYHAGSTLRSHIRAEGLQDKVRILPVVFKIDAQRVAFSPTLAAPARARVVAALRLLERSGDLQRLRERYGLD